MLSFLVELILLISLGTLIYLFAGVLPKIEHDSNVLHGGILSLVNKYVSLDKLDEFFHGFFEKTLRKVKVILMKLDNIINAYLDQIKVYSSIADSKEEMKEKLESIKRGKDE